MGIQHMQRAQFTAKAQREVVEILFLEYQCKKITGKCCALPSLDGISSLLLKGLLKLGQHLQLWQQMVPLHSQR